MIKLVKETLNEDMYSSKKDALNALNLIQHEASPDASLIGGFGKGKESSNHDIDILIPNKKLKSKQLKNKLFNALKAESVESTDWGGWYFNKTIFGDVDIFFTTEEFDY